MGHCLHFLQIDLKYTRMHTSYLFCPISNGKLIIIKKEKTNNVGVLYLFMSQNIAYKNEKTLLGKDQNI